MSNALPRPWTVDEFLEWEASQQERYEFVDGVVFNMGGGTLAHAAIRDNLTALLRQELRATACRAFSETVKVVTPTHCFYPDLVITCAHVTLTDDRIAEPRVIIEVLSRSTADRDRGAKWVGYQEIPSLEHYVLVAQHERRIDCFTRTDGGWLLQVLRPPAREVALESIGTTLALDAIYDGSGT
ncbi:MAG: Uma2 family endonuclease [Myxococcota bacterium]